MEQSTEQEVGQNVSVHSEANSSTGKEGKPKGFQKIKDLWKSKDVPQEKQSKATTKSNKVKAENYTDVPLAREENPAIMEESKMLVPTQNTFAEQNTSLEVVHQVPLKAETPTTVEDKSSLPPTVEAVTEQNPSLRVEPKIPARMEESATLPTLEKVAEQHFSPDSRPQNDILGHKKSAVKTVSPDQRQITVSIKNDATVSTKTATHIELEQRKQHSNSTSRTSLSSLGPSTSSLCHLTELAQPKPEALQTTLKCLRHVNPSDTEKLENVRAHLRDLRNRPKLVTCRKSSNPNNQPQRRNTPATASVVKASKDRITFERIAARFYVHLEGRWATFDNFESTMPVQLGYYHAAYDAIMRAFGKPYTKSSLELYQLLATELGLEAEMFVIDKTPKIDPQTHGDVEKHVENVDAPMPIVS